jgi:hypothetical protein
MSIDFNPTPDSCATYGYSFGFQCDGITHTVDQNWRMMLSPDGTTFYAPVSTVASISSTQGPDGPRGLTGLTGATGATGMTGADGPAGITVEDASFNKMLYVIPTPAAGDPLVTYLKAFGADCIGRTSAGGPDQDIFTVQSAREFFPAAISPIITAGGATFDHTVSGNNVRYNLNATNVNYLVLQKLSAGDYVNITFQQTASSPTADRFKSAFRATNADNIAASVVNTNVRYAGGITYNMGTTENDVDVFYVYCLSSSAGATPTIELLVNHQRYHA